MVCADLFLALFALAMSQIWRHNYITGCLLCPSHHFHTTSARCFSPSLVASILTIGHSHSPMLLARLPDELVLNVVTLCSLKSWYMLSRTCRRLREFTRPLLRQHALLGAVIRNDHNAIRRMYMDGANISEKFFSVEPFCATLTPDRIVDRGTGRPIELNALSS